jgi:hypothetical protein
MPGKSFFIGLHAVHVHAKQECGGDWVASVVVDGPGLDAASTTYFETFDDPNDAIAYGLERSQAVIEILSRRGPCP